MSPIAPRSRRRRSSIHERAGPGPAQRGWEGARSNNAPKPVGPQTGTPHLCRSANRARVYDRDPICGEHYGQRPCRVPHQQAGHMAAPTSSAISIKKNLANTEPSTHGTRYALSSVHLKGRKPPHCRRSERNVGLSAHSRPDSEVCRRSAHDPKRPFTLGMVVVCNADEAVIRPNRSDDWS